MSHHSPLHSRFQGELNGLNIPSIEEGSVGRSRSNSRNGPYSPVAIRNFSTSGSPISRRTHEASEPLKYCTPLFITSALFILSALSLLYLLSLSPTWKSTKRGALTFSPEQHIHFGKIAYSIALQPSSSPSFTPQYLQDYATVVSSVGVPWMQERMNRLLEEYWKSIRNQKLPQIHQLKQKNIVILLGLVLAKMHWGLHLGAPMSDFMQHADYLSVLSLLGHNVTVITEFEQIKLQPFLQLQSYDIIITDYLGLFSLHQVIDVLSNNNFEASAPEWQALMCKVRIIDAYGTEEEFIKEWLKGGTAHMRQFWTLFPTAPNNTFLGFSLTPTSFSHSTTLSLRQQKKNQMLIWAKESVYFAYDPENSRNLDNISDFLTAIWSASNATLLTTIRKDGPNDTLPLLPFFKHKGVMKAVEYEQTLQESIALIGIGAPLEGVAWLFALAKGTPYINPHYTKPYRFPAKPMTRLYSSQVPYAEQFTPPLVYNIVDTHNITAINNTIMEFLNAPPIEPYIDPNYSAENYFDRIMFLIETQEFCTAEGLAYQNQLLEQIKLLDNIEEKSIGNAAVSDCKCPYCIDCIYKNLCLC